MGAALPDHLALARLTSNGETADGVRKFILPQEKRIDPETRTIDFIVSNATRDRDGDIVDPNGWELDRYRSNPVVLWAHNPGELPVARALSIGVEDNALRAVARFATAEENPKADMVFRLYQGGYLNAVSAGFMPREFEMFEEDGRRGARFFKQELWEFSAVPIPSNPDALVMARSKGIDIAPAREWIEQALDERLFPEFRDLLSKCFVTLTKQVHSSVQDDLRKANFEAREAEPEVVADETAADSAPDVVEPEPEPVEAAAPDAHEPELIEPAEPEAPAPTMHTLSASEAKTLRQDWPEIAWMADAAFPAPEAVDSWREHIAAQKDATLKAREAEHGITIKIADGAKVPLTKELVAQIAEAVGGAVRQEFRRLAGRV